MFYPCVMLLILLVMTAVLWRHSTVAADVDLSVNPTKINDGVTSSLDINCTFSINGTSSMAEIISLAMSREESSGGNTIQLATLTEFSAHEVNVISNEGISADGFLNPRGQTYIHLHWDSPSNQQVGIYRCTADGLDPVGQNTVVVNTTIVTSGPLDLQDLVQELRHMKADNKALESKLSQYVNSTTVLQQKVSVLEGENQDRVPSMFELPPLIYNNKRYYIAKPDFRDFSESIMICKAHGGILAEMDDADEFHAVQNYMRNFTGIARVFIGGTDQAEDGNWTLPSTNEVMPYVEWTPPGQPISSSTSNCVGLKSDLDWLMYASFCHTNSPQFYYRYMCEMPDI